MAKPLASLAPIHKRTITKLLLIAFLCSLSYFIGSYQNSKSSFKTTLLADLNYLQINISTSPPQASAELDFEAHHPAPDPLFPPHRLGSLASCLGNFTNYCPCQDTARMRRFDVAMFFHRERHCPEGDVERMRCLVPRPRGYWTAFRWPKSRDYAWFANVPNKRPVESKRQQNWVRLVGDLLVFPGGGTSFPTGEGVRRGDWENRAAGNGGDKDRA